MATDSPHGRVHRFGELEAVVMALLWAHDGPTTVRELHDELLRQRHIAYTTVLSTADNLHRKGWVGRDRDGRAFRYWPVITREQYSARLMREALAVSGDLGGVFTHFVQQITVDETQALREALRRTPQDPTT